MPSAVGDLTGSKQVGPPSLAMQKEQWSSEERIETNLEFYFGRNQSYLGVNSFEVRNKGSNHIREDPCIIVIDLIEK